MRGVKLSWVVLLAALWSLGCSGEPAPTAMPSAAPAPAADEAGLAEAPAAAEEEAPVEPPAAKVPEMACTGGLMALYREIVTKGCAFKTTDTDLAMTYRVLRNAPFAARGRKFKSPELTAFFKSEGFCSGGDSYKPEHDTVTIEPGPDLDCIGKLRAREDALRQGKQPPAGMEAFILSNPQGGIETEAKRMAGHEVLESKATFEQGDSGWSMFFYSEWMEDDFKAESSVIVMCDGEGNNCEHQFAG